MVACFKMGNYLGLIPKKGVEIDHLFYNKTSDLAPKPLF